MTRGNGNYNFGIVGLVVLIGSCPDVGGTIDGWAAEVREARDDLRQSNPDSCNQNVRRVKVPFGWKLESSQRCDERIRLEHHHGAKALIAERQSGQGRVVNWHITFRRPGLFCVTSGGFSYQTEQPTQCFSPPVRIYGKSRLVRHIFVRWPASEVRRLSAALNTKTAQAVCTPD